MVTNTFPKDPVGDPPPVGQWTFLTGPRWAEDCDEWLDKGREA